VANQIERAVLEKHGIKRIADPTVTPPIPVEDAAAASGQPATPGAPAAKKAKAAATDIPRA
jgi:hypothetical protein